MLKGRVGHALKFFAKDQLWVVEAHLFANVPRHKFVVSGEDFHFHPVPLHGCKREGRIRARRIGKGQKSSQDQGMFVGHIETAVCVNPSIGDRQNPKPLRTQIVEGLPAAVPGLGVQRNGAAVGLIGIRKYKNAFRSAFRDQKTTRVAFLFFDNDGKTTALEIEWDFVALDVHVWIGTFHFQNRGIQRATNPRLKFGCSGKRVRQAGRRLFRKHPQMQRGSSVRS